MNTVKINGWKLGISIGWQPDLEHESCITCNGKGTVGGGFKSIDGPRECYPCNGKGFTTKYPETERPELPDGLIEHMRKAWHEFNNKQS